MAQVHLIQQSPFSSSALEDCLRVCAPEDSLVLMHDACYAAMSAINTDTKRIFALKEDVEERGLTDKLQAPVRLIEYQQLVALIAEHRHCQSWF